MKYLAILLISLFVTSTTYSSEIDYIDTLYTRAANNGSILGWKKHSYKAELYFYYPENGSCEESHRDGRHQSSIDHFGPICRPLGVAFYVKAVLEENNFRSCEEISSKKQRKSRSVKFNSDGPSYKVKTKNLQLTSSCVCRQKIKNEFYAADYRDCLVRYFSDEELIVVHRAIVERKWDIDYSKPRRMIERWL